MTTKEVKKYEDLTVEERFERINAYWLQIEDVIAGQVNSGDVISFFICLHELNREITRFLTHYFNDKNPAQIIGNVDILNKVTKIQLMINVR